jgi:hypothetical protein
VPGKAELEAERRGQKGVAKELFSISRAVTMIKSEEVVALQLGMSDVATDDATKPCESAMW